MQIYTADVMIAEEMDLEVLRRLADADTLQSSGRKIEREVLQMDFKGSLGVSLLGGGIWVSGV